jgi:hypothetical protein
VHSGARSGCRECGSEVSVGVGVSAGDEVCARIETQRSSKPSGNQTRVDRPGQGLPTSPPCVPLGARARNADDENGNGDGDEDRDG